MTFHTNVINCHKKHHLFAQLEDKLVKAEVHLSLHFVKEKLFSGEKHHGSLNHRILPEHVQCCECRVVVEVEGIEDALNVGGGSLLQDVVSEDPGKGHLDGELDHHLLICSPVHSLTWILLPIVISR